MNRKSVFNLTARSRVLIFLALTMVAASEAPAALMASDNAGNYSSWTSGANQGSAFGNWTFNNSGSSGEFLATGNNGNSQINTGGNAWGFFANSGGVASAVRPFTGGALGVGQRFMLKMDNGFIDNGSTVGFGLQNGSGANRFEFYFIGGQSAYTLNASGVGTQSGPGFTSTGLSLVFSQLAGNNFSLDVEVLGGSTFSYNGTLSASDISQIRFFNANAGSGGNHDVFFNDIAVVPETINVALGIVGGLFGLGLAVRHVRISRLSAV